MAYGTTFCQDIYLNSGNVTPWLSRLPDNKLSRDCVPNGTRHRVTSEVRNVPQPADCTSKYTFAKKYYPSQHLSLWAQRQKPHSFLSKQHDNQGSSRSLHLSGIQQATCYSFVKIMLLAVLPILETSLFLYHSSRLFVLKHHHRDRFHHLEWIVWYRWKLVILPNFKRVNYGRANIIPQGRIKTLYILASLNRSKMHHLCLIYEIFHIFFFCFRLFILTIL